ncbi:MAG: cytidylate kinase-like family protein [Tetrasphaera sp.]
MTSKTPPAVVTIFEDYGCGAEQIGPIVAADLGVEWLGQRFSSEAIEAGETKAYEDGTIGRFLSSMGRFNPHPEGARSTAIGQEQDNENLEQNHIHVVQAAKDGVVVLGRNATAILRQTPDALHVRLVGKLGDRIKRAMTNDGIDEPTAERRQKNEDRVRADMTQRFYAWDPNDPAEYDLVVNTSTMPAETAATLIAQAWRAKVAQT